MIAPRQAGTMLGGASAIDPAADVRVALERRRGETWAWVAVLLVVAGTAALRWRVLDAPLERDEGEYAYVGQWMLRGVPPYAEAWNMKLPGIYAAYACVLAVFGETARGVHLGLLVANAAAIVLVFLLARRLADAWTGVAAAAAFAVLAVSVAVEGVFANGEHFVLPFALGGLLLVLRALDHDSTGHDSTGHDSTGHDSTRRDSTRDLALGGLLLGAGVVVKQHGFVFPLAAGIAVLLDRPAAAARRLLLLVLATLLPYLLTCLAMWIAGVFPSFWLWTFRYARAYVSRVGFSENASQLGTVCRSLAGTAPIVCAVAGAGLLAHVRRRGFLLAFVVLSVLSVFPGFLFRAHYFVLALPALAILFGIGVSGIGRFVARGRRPVLAAAATAALVLGAVLDSVVRQRDPLFRQHPLELAWNTLGSPFHLAPSIAERLKADTRPTDRIAILGSEPELYFYADRRAATGYLYTYPLMEDQPYAAAMLEQFQREIESRAPTVLVWVNLPWSWLPSEAPWRKVVGWFEGLRRDYDLVARYDVGVPRLRVIEGPDLGTVPAPQYSIDLYRRRPR